MREPPTVCQAAALLITGQPTKPPTPHFLLPILWKYIFGEKTQKVLEQKKLENARRAALLLISDN